MELYEFRVLQNAKMRKEAKKKDYRATLWLADVKKIYEQYEYNLGYKRGGDKKPRVSRPAVVVDKQGKHYRAFFLSASGDTGYRFKNENCMSQYCLAPFYWKADSRIFIKSRKNGKTRFIFLLRETDLEILMEFCGLCIEQYIESIVDKKKQRCLMKF